MSPGCIDEVGNACMLEHLVVSRIGTNHPGVMLSAAGCRVAQPFVFGEPAP